MAETRLGRQTPTLSVVLPYTQTKGAEAIAIYNKSGRTAQQWQELMMYDIMALDSDEKWLHMKFGWSVPRRNGKSEILGIRAEYGVTHGERILYTAHRTTTSHNAWEKIIERLTKAGYVEGEDFKTTKQFGLEHIEWLDGSGGVINFRTRSSKGGLGEGYDLLIIDEAQEYTSDQESALKYVVTDSKNPQTLMCGTPPTAVSSGTVFLTYRRDTLAGKNENAGWAEWSVPVLSDAHDPELWYQTNPSLPYLQQFSDGFAKKIARALDIAAIHGLNPADKTASSIVGNNCFDKSVTQTVTISAASPINPDDAVDQAAKLIVTSDGVVNGIAMSPAFGSDIGSMKTTDSNLPIYPEFRFGANPAAFCGIPSDVNNTVSFNNSDINAIVGDFSNAFRWGYAEDIPIEIIRYGNPDGLGDLKQTNEIVLRAEAFIGWGILDAASFALIKAGA